MGGIAGGPAGARLGFSVGAVLGGALFPPRQGNQNLGRLADLRVSGSQYGTAIPQAFGAFRLPLNIIWVKLDPQGNALVETRHKHGKLLAPQPTTFTYSVSFAGLVCRGPIGVRRIWAADRTIFDLYGDPPSAYTIRIYRGDETQLADPLIASAQGGANQVPAYRGSCYIVFESLPLQDWGNAIPNPLSAEVDFTYPELIFSHPSLQSYWRFENETGKLTDIGPKGFTLSDTSPASTFVTGCFQALNGASGGGRGIFSTAAGQALKKVTGNVPEFQGPNLTVEGWFQWRGFSGGSASEFEWNDPFNNMWSFEIELLRLGANTRVQYDLGTDGTTTTVVHNPQVTRDSNWHHVMVTFVAAGTSVLYLDGAAVSTQTAPASMAITSTNSQIEVRIGEYAWDELAVYNAALTAADALAHYQKGVNG